MIKEDNKVICEEQRVLEGYVYTYRLILHSARKYSSFGMPLYSLSVAMRDSSGKSTHAETKEIFSEEIKARRFFDKLVRNLATPIDLAYIIEDEFT